VLSAPEPAVEVSSVVCAEPAVKVSSVVCRRATLDIFFSFFFLS